MIIQYIGKVLNSYISFTKSKKKENRGKNMNNSNLPNQTGLTIRVIVAGYLVYLGYSIITSGDEKSWLLWASAVFFCIFGVVFCLLSLKDLVTGRYQGGKLDPEENPEDDNISAESGEADRENMDNKQNADNDSVGGDSTVHENDNLEEITDAEVIDAVVNDARLMSKKENDLVVTASSKDFKEV